jgi:hypothetical protein
MFSSITSVEMIAAAQNLDLDRSRASPSRFQSPTRRICEGYMSRRASPKVNTRGLSTHGQDNTVLTASK